MLHAKNFGLAIGIAWSAGVLIIGLLSMYTGFADQWVALIGNAYLGYEATVTGSVIGAIWGFFDGFVGGYVIAWVYNKLPR